MDYQILVNKQNFLPEKFCVESLVKAYSLYQKGILLHEETYRQWLILKDEVAKIGHTIEIESGYRSYNCQAELMKNRLQEKGENYVKQAVAFPGASEHQTGLAVDYCIYRDGRFIVGLDMTEDKAVKHTNSIVHLYGFILRYPEGKEETTGYMYEPWHLRYVGIPLAAYLHETGMTLDEYHDEEKIKANR